MQKILMILALVFVVTACDRNTEDRQGYRQEMEEATAPNDYTEGTDVKKRRQTGREEALPEFEPSKEKASE